MINLKKLRQLSGEALGGPMVQWPSEYHPWWTDPRIRRAAVQAFQDAVSPDVVFALLNRLEAAEAVLERVHLVLVDAKNRFGDAAQEKR